MNTTPKTLTLLEMQQGEEVQRLRDLLDAKDAEIFRMTQQLAEVLLREQRRVNELEIIVRLVADWNRKYPSSRIYGEYDIRQISKEMDEINHACIAALASPTTAEQNTGDPAP